MPAPPLATLYQAIVPPAHPLASKSIIPGPQRDAATTVGAAGKAFIVAVTGTLELIHPV